MICPNCRNEVPEGSAFCNKCGAAVPAGAQMQSYTQPAMNTQTIETQAPERKGFSIASLVLGITSLILWLITYRKNTAMMRQAGSRSVSSQTAIPCSLPTTP